MGGISYLINVSNITLNSIKVSRYVAITRNFKMQKIMPTETLNVVVVFNFEVDRWLKFKVEIFFHKYIHCSYFSYLFY